MLFAGKQTNGHVGEFHFTLMIIERQPMKKKLNVKDNVAKCVVQIYIRKHTFESLFYK